MRKVVIVTDGTCELPDDLIFKYNIHVVPIYVIFEKSNEVFQVSGESGTISKEDFYKKLRKELSTTEVPPPKEFYEYFMRASEEAESVIGIFASKKLSAVMLNATAANSGIHDKDITIVDSMVAGPALGLLVTEAAKMAQNGATKDNILVKLRQLIPMAAHTCIVDTLQNIYRSGRVGWLQKFLGQALQIKPIIHVKNGATFNGGSLRGREEVLEKLKFMAPYALKHSITDQIIIWHARYFEAANEILEVMKKHNAHGKDIRIVEAGPITGTYLGEKMLGLIYIGHFDSSWLS